MVGREEEKTQSYNYIYYFSFQTCSYVYIPLLFDGITIHMIT